MLTKLKANDSTASKPEACKRCALTYRIEPSVSLSLVPVVLALQLKDFDLVAFPSFHAAGTAAEATWPSSSTGVPGYPGTALRTALGCRCR